MTKAICSTLKGGAEQSGAVGQTELAPPPYRPPFRGAVRVEQERSEGGAVEPAGRLAQLAVRVERLTVSRRNPEAFFIERSDIAEELRRAARAIDAQENCAARVPLAVDRAGRLRRGTLLATPILDTKVRT